MPGICGLIDLRADATSGDLEKMRRHLSVGGTYIEESIWDADCRSGFARTSLGFVNTTPQPATIGSRMAMMDGELYEPEFIASRLPGQEREFGDPQRQAEIILQVDAASDRSLWRLLHGSFAAAIWDRDAQRLVLVSDRFGTRPLYYTTVPGQFRFASNIKSLLVEPAVSRDWSRAGVAQFFTFGHYLGNDTSLAAVRVLPAASCLIYDRHAQRISIESYLPNGTEELEVDTPTSASAWLAGIDRAFVRAVERRLQPGKVGISLSGGLDARTILGVMPEKCPSVKSVCLGVAGSLDHRSAAELARQAGCQHHNHVLGYDFLQNFREHLENMVRLTDGQYLSQCIVMPTLPLYRQLGIEVLLRGHAGELMHMRKAYAYSLDDEALQLQTADAVEEWLWRRLQAYMLDGVRRPLFRPPFGDGIVDSARESLRSAMEECGDCRPPTQQVWRLFVSQRLRRETTLSLVKFRSVVEPRIPYLDNELVAWLFAAPLELKLDDKIQAYILGRHRPGFLHVPNANTGAPLGAGPWHIRFSELRMRVLAKLKFPGYQPYERLGLWLRRELAATVREILLSEQCLTRGIFDPEGVRDVVNNHLDHQRNHTFLLMAMMIFELGQRYLQGEPGLQF